MDCPVVPLRGWALLSSPDLVSQFALDPPFKDSRRRNKDPWRVLKALEPYSFQHYGGGEREKRQATAREQSLETDLNALVPAEQGLTDYEVKNACRCVPFYNCCNDTATAGFCAEAIDIKNNLDFKENRCSVDYFECCSFTDLCGEDVDCLIQVSLVPPSASQSSSPETTSSSSETNSSSEATITPPSIAYKPVPPTIREPPALSEPIPCGRRNFDGVGVRLAGSAEIQQAQYGEFPWMVALLREDTIGRSQPIDVYVCGAVLISPHLVATAAHCVNDY
ncbi:unnamed protein product, partial [Notodromas monacha]